VSFKGKPSPTLLIDGDILLYEACSANEVEQDWGDDLWTLHSDFGKCRTTLIDKLQALQKELKTKDFIFCISDDVNFRKEVLPTYKYKRKSVRKPVAYHALKKWAQEEYHCEMWPKLEADDVLGILATTGKKHPNQELIIVSEDKDLKTIPGKLYRKGELLQIPEGEADYWFMYQTLIGDITDGYKGCPKIGDKTAEKLLTPFILELDHKYHTMHFDLKGAWKAVVQAYEKQGLTEADALQQARCARILRATEWNPETKQLKLWTP
jgi:DNA polymerase-1